MFKEASKCLLPYLFLKVCLKLRRKNAEGFAKECAIVTHYRLKNDPDKPEVNGGS
jgi:prolyl-tRNA synthetase